MTLEQMELQQMKAQWYSQGKFAFPWPDEMLGSDEPYIMALIRLLHEVWTIMHARAELKRSAKMGRSQLVSNN
jgi:hypothetical protein